jgi:hypothetical protein
LAAAALLRASASVVHAFAEVTLEPKGEGGAEAHAAARAVRADAAATRAVLRGAFRDPATGGGDGRCLAFAATIELDALGVQLAPEVQKGTPNLKSPSKVAVSFSILIQAVCSLRLKKK